MRPCRSWSAGGAHEWLETWLEYGGDATMASFSGPAEEVQDAQSAMVALEAADPGLFDWLDRPAARGALA